MSGNKRQRELARAKYERQQARRATSGSRRRRNQRIVAVLVVLALVVGSVAWVVYANVSSDDVVAADSWLSSSELTDILQSAQAAAEAASPSATPSASASASVEASPASTDEPIEEPTVLDCHAPGTVRANDKSYPSAPTGETGTSITFTTNCGNIVIALDAAAPATVASETFLAKDGFYNNTQCHRLTIAGIFVLQCGDPRATAPAAPGSRSRTRTCPGEANNYPAGTVAMANSGLARPEPVLHRLRRHDSAQRLHDLGQCHRGSRHRQGDRFGGRR